MKKTTILLIIALIVCLASVFAFTACNFDNIKIDGEGKVELSADGKEDSFELLEGFFEEALKDANVVVTVKNGETTQFTESIVGDKNFVDLGNGTKTYAFKQGNEFISAVDSESGKYYLTGEDYYKTYYCYFLSRTIKMYKEGIPEEGATFTCSSVIEDKDTITKDKQVTHSTANLIFEATVQEGTLKITATAKDDLVQTVTITTNDTASGRSATTTMTFVYGSAVVTTPDITNWTNASGGAIEMDEGDNEENNGSEPFESGDEENEEENNGDAEEPASGEEESNGEK